MSDIIKLLPKKKSGPSTEEMAKQSIDEYYTNMMELKDDLQAILTIAYDNEGQLLITSNGIDMKSALWMMEEFKMNCLLGTFDD